jgi:hypothetical protein
MEVSKARGEWVDPALSRCTFATWAEEWAATAVDLRPRLGIETSGRQGFTWSPASASCA